MEAFERCEFATAFRELRPLAERGDPWAQLALGWMYAYGSSSEPTEEADFL
jgi:TPR repeat protein